MFDLFRNAYEKFWERQLAKIKQVPAITVDSDKLRESLNKSLQDLAQKNGVPFTPILSAPSDGCQHQYRGNTNYCGRKRFEASNLCLWHERSTNKYQTSVVSQYFGEAITFKEAIEREVQSGRSLSGAYLVEVQLGGNFNQRGATLIGANLRSADMRRSRLSYVNLRNADLCGANLESSYLGNADLADTNMTFAQLFNTKFRNNDFSRVVGLEKISFRNWNDGQLIPKYQILEMYPEQAEPMYRALISYFVGKGILDDASWAAYKYRLMRHAILRQRLDFRISIGEEAARQIVINGQADLRRIIENGVINWISSLGGFAVSWLNRFIWGYGEKPMRVAAFAIGVIVFYAVIYNSFSALKPSGQGFYSALYFSVVTFTTVGYGDLLPSENFRLLAASEALVGLVISGLFLFALSRRAIGRA